MGLVRKNINVSKEVSDWYRDEAKRMGVSQSALMSMAMAKYIEDKENMNTIKEMLSKYDMDKLKETVD